MKINHEGIDKRHSHTDFSVCPVLKDPIIRENSTCQAPIPLVGKENGRLKMRHILKASLRISVILLRSAQNAALGNTDENKNT